MGKFINPFTDWGFKHIFGMEVDKDILIEFLNDLLAGEHVITDLRIMNNEQMPETALERKVIFDIHCETSNGERIIIEMQNREQPYFKDRTLYYLARSVVDQGIAKETATPEPSAPTATATQSTQAETTITESEAGITTIKTPTAHPEELQTNE